MTGREGGRKERKGYEGREDERKKEKWRKEIEKKRNKERERVIATNRCMFSCCRLSFGTQAPSNGS